MTGSTAAGASLLERLLLPEEAAKILNLSTSWLAKARGRGDGPPFMRFGRSVRYSREELVRCVESRQQ